MAEYPTIFIEKQESLAHDKFATKGTSKEVHILAKNIPFVIHVGGNDINLNNSPLNAKLYYDFEEETDQKEVELLKQSSPIDYVAHVNGTGDKAAVEVRLSVLSSQHEGAFFRIKFSATDVVTGISVDTFSHPIKVISKRNQVKKMLERNEVIPAEPIPPSKRTSSDIIADALLRLEEQQRDQGRLLQQLMTERQTAQSARSSKDFHPIQHSVSIPDPNDMDFDAAFKRFLDAYKKIPAEDRPFKIRKTMKTASELDSQSLGEFVNIYNNEVLLGSEQLMGPLMDLPPLPSNGNISNGNSHSGSCSCSECPHKRQLERLDKFYSEFLLDPLSPEAEHEL